MNITKRAFLAVVGLAVIALMLAPVVTAKGYTKGPVTRPFQISGELTFVDAFGGLPSTLIDRGVASGFGKFVDVGKYLFKDGKVVGYGIFYAANGDQIFWKDDGSGGTKIEFTGGTGRFDGATGYFTVTTIDQYTEAGPENTTSYVLVYEGEGTITH
jgi:hypothetical protein